MVDTKSNMQLSDLNYKPHGGKSLRYIIDRVIGAHFYPPPGLEHCKTPILDQFNGPYHINNKSENNKEIKSAIME